MIFAVIGEPGCALKREDIDTEEGARPTVAMMSLCACFARRDKRYAVFRKLSARRTGSCEMSFIPISSRSKSLISLSLATVHGVVFGVAHPA